jgi:hypothetical protein
MIMSRQLVQLPTGVSLEVQLTTPPDLSPSASDGGNKLAICLHPWSWLGGRMDDQCVLRSI